MESLQIRRWNEIPPAEEFRYRIEKRNVPAVISGCVKDWKAFSKWDVSNGGLDYLQDRMLCISMDTANKKVINTHGNSGHNHGNSDMSHQTASLKGRNPKQSFMMNELEPLAIQSLHELVSIVHDCVKPEGDTAADPSVIREENEVKKIVCRK